MCIPYVAAYSPSLYYSVNNFQLGLGSSSTKIGAKEEAIAYLSFVVLP